MMDDEGLSCDVEIRCQRMSTDSSSLAGRWGALMNKVQANMP